MRMSPSRFWRPRQPAQRPEYASPAAVGRRSQLDPSHRSSGSSPAAPSGSRRRLSVLRPVRLPEGVGRRSRRHAGLGAARATWEACEEGFRSSSAWPSPRRSAASLRLRRRARGAGRPVPGRVVPRRRLRCARRSRGVLGARLPRGEAVDGGRAGGDPLRGGDRADGDARGVRAPRPGRAARAGRAGGIGRRVPSGDRRAARARVVVRGAPARPLMAARGGPVIG